MSNSTALFSVQKKLYDTINVPAVTGLALVFDEVKQGQAYPYIEIGEIEEKINNVFAKNGRELHITLHIYTQTGGYLLAEQIIEQLNILLDDLLFGDPTNAPAPFDGWSCWQSEYEEGLLTKEFDQTEIRHATVRYHIEVQQI
jgi:hypothetical protein